MNDLKDALFAFCEEHDLSVDKPTTRRLKVDYIMSSGNGKAVGVILLDWKRAIGVDIVIRAERIQKSTRVFNQIIIITNNYSDPARALGDLIKVGVYDLEDLKHEEVFKTLEMS